MSKVSESLISELKREGRIEDAPIVEAPREEVEEDKPKKRQVARLLKRREDDKKMLMEYQDLVLEQGRRLEALENERNAPSAYQNELDRLLGNDTPEKKEFSRGMGRILEQIKEEAETKSVEKVSKLLAQERAQEEKEVEEMREVVSDSISEVEERYGLDLTSDTEEADKRYDKFISLIKKYSPKDSEGNIKEYADFDAIAEIFQEQESKGKVLDKKRQIASRGSSSSPNTLSGKEAQKAATDEYLKRVGWIPKSKT